jgi:hypothetical protein
MTPRYRILKNAKGYIVEVEDVKWSLFGLKKQWKPFILSAGLKCAWHHRTYDLAMASLLDEVEMETIKNANFNKTL